MRVQPGMTVVAPADPAQAAAALRATLRTCRARSTSASARRGAALAGPGRALRARTRCRLIGDGTRRRARRARQPSPRGASTPPSCSPSAGIARHASPSSSSSARRPTTTSPRCSRSVPLAVTVEAHYVDRRPRLARRRGDRRARAGRAGWSAAACATMPRGADRQPELSPRRATGSSARAGRRRPSSGRSAAVRAGDGGRRWPRSSSRPQPGGPHRRRRGAATSDALADASARSYELVLVTNGCRDDSRRGLRSELAARAPGRRASSTSPHGGWGRAVRAGLRTPRRHRSATRTRRAPRREMLALRARLRARVPGGRASRRTARSATTGAGGSARCSTTSSAARCSTSRSGTSTARRRSSRARSTRLLEPRARRRPDRLEFDVICRREGYPIVEVPVLATHRHGGTLDDQLRAPALRMYRGAFELLALEHAVSPAAAATTPRWERARRARGAIPRRSSRTGGRRRTVDPRPARGRARPAAFWEPLERARASRCSSRASTSTSCVALSVEDGQPATSPTCALPHPSGIAVDRGAAARRHVASTRNPNQVFELARASRCRARLRDAGARGGRSCRSRSRFYPGAPLPPRPGARRRRRCTRTPSAQNAVVRCSTRGGLRAASGGRAASSATACPTSAATTCSSTRSPPARRSSASFFSASADAPRPRRPGPAHFPVDGRGVIFSRRDPRAGRPRADAAALGAPARRARSGWTTAATARSAPARRRTRSTPVATLPGWTRGLCVRGRRRLRRHLARHPAFRQYAPGLDVDRSVCGVHARRRRARARSSAASSWPAGNQIFAVETRRRARDATGFPFVRARRAPGPRARRCSTPSARLPRRTPMSDDFRLLMIGAMYENGGNTTHRFLDGHPAAVRLPVRVAARHAARQRPAHLDVPGEVPLAGVRARRHAGAGLPRDHRRGGQGPRAHAARVSKFRDQPFDLSDDERARSFVGSSSAGRAARARQRGGLLPGHVRGLEGPPPHRATSRSTSATARSSSSTPTRSSTTCPARTSCTSCATRGRRTPTPRSARCRCRCADYMLGWTINQYYALLFRERYPDRMHIVRAEDVMADPVGTLGAVLEALGLERRRLARRAELERQGARRGLPVGHDPHRHARGQPRHGRRARPTTSRPRCRSGRGTYLERSATRASSGTASPTTAAGAQRAVGAAGRSSPAPPASSAPTSSAGCSRTATRCTRSCRPGADRRGGSTASRGDVRLPRGRPGDAAALGRSSRSARPDWVFHLAAHGAYSWQTRRRRASSRSTSRRPRRCSTPRRRRAASSAFVHAGSSSEYGFKDHAPARTSGSSPTATTPSRRPPPRTTARAGRAGERRSRRHPAALLRLRALGGARAA